MTALQVVSPAPIVETIELYLQHGRVKPVTMKAIMLQLARSRTEGYLVAGELLAATMFYPLKPERDGEDLRELVFVCKPALALHLVGFIHAARSIRASLAKDAPIRVRAHVRPDHLPGRRLAALCGMSCVGLAGDFERFEFEGSPDDRPCPGR